MLFENKQCLSHQNKTINAILRNVLQIFSFFHVCLLQNQRFLDRTEQNKITATRKPFLNLFNSIQKSKRFIRTGLYRKIRLSETLHKQPLWKIGPNCWLSLYKGKHSNSVGLIGLEKQMGSQFASFSQAD